MLVIKNVILYDPYQNVVGFCELKNLDDRTSVKLKHNLAPSPDTIVTINGEAVRGDSIESIDLEDEIMVCIIQKTGNTVATLASGIINPRPIDMPPSPLSKTFASLPPLKSILAETSITSIDRGGDHKPCHKTIAAREIDQVLRAVCQIDDNNQGVCKTCPYREFFFGDTVYDQPLVNAIEQQKTEVSLG